MSVQKNMNKMRRILSNRSPK